MEALPVNDRSPVFKLMGLACSALLAFSATARAQEIPAAPAKPGARLLFVPPPMEGTISLGIYDGTGKLVRALHREEEVGSDAFGKALNGLITVWDGRNDAGALMPAGKYFARGIMAGDIGIEGEAVHGNDWITDENSPRVRRIRQIAVNEKGGLNLTWELANGSPGRLGESGTLPPPSGITVRVDGGRLFIRKNDSEKEAPLAAGETVTGACAGFGDTAWAIVRTGSSSEVRAYSAAGEFARRLAFAPGDPIPVSIQASPFEATLHLLEETPSLQRVRTLTLQSAPSPPETSGTGAVPTSLWKTVLSRTILFSDTPGQVFGTLKFPDGTPFVPEEKISVSLLPNPLVQGNAGSLEICAGIDAQGSFLKTPDGLLLKRVSDTPGLKWAVIGRTRGSKVVVLYQSDGAVVEEYRIARLANMMAFDCGDFDFEPAKVK